MGCGNSQPLAMTSIGTLEPRNDDDEDKDDDDEQVDERQEREFFIPLEDGIDEVKLEDVHDEYPDADLRSKEDLHGTSVPFYKEWKPQMDDFLPDVTYDPTKARYPSIGDIDQRAKQAPSSCKSSFEDLIQYLTRDVHKSDTPERLTVRGLLIWLCDQRLDECQSGSTDLGTPEGYLSLLAQRKTTYASVFTILCRKAGIPCVKINGISKAGKFYQPGNEKTEEMESSWNAVFIENTWRIIYPYWTCQRLQGENMNGWVKIDGFGVNGLKLQFEDLNDRMFEEYFFMCNPKEFIFLCRPYDEKWQLLRKPKSERTFLKMPYILPPFFGLGFTLKSTKQSVLTTDDGFLRIDLETIAKNGNTLDLYFEINVIETKDEGPNDAMLEPEVLRRLITMVRCGRKWTFHVSLPVVGSYYLVLFGGPHKRPLLRLAEFRLECNRVPKKCEPLCIDTGIIGFGPGPTIDNCGLHFPSKRNGIYPVHVNEIFTLTFLLDQEDIDAANINARLCFTTEKPLVASKVNLDSAVAYEVIKRRLQYQVTVTIPCDGEFILSLFMSDNDYNAVNVCNYILSTLLPQPKERWIQMTYKKSTEKKIVRTRLRGIMEEDRMQDVEEHRYDERITAIQEAIDMCIKRKIAGDDEEVEAASIRVQYLTARKEIHNAYLRSHLNVTKTTIETLKQSRFVFSLRRSIHKLEMLQQTLEEEWKERIAKGFRRKTFQQIVNVIANQKQNGLK